MHHACSNVCTVCVLGHPQVSDLRPYQDWRGSRSRPDHDIWRLRPRSDKDCRYQSKLQQDITNGSLTSTLLLHQWNGNSAFLYRKVSFNNFLYLFAALPANLNHFQKHTLLHRIENMNKLQLRWQCVPLGVTNRVKQGSGWILLCYYLSISTSLDQKSEGGSSEAEAGPG